MLSAAALDMVTDDTVRCFRDGNMVKAKKLFSALIENACFALPGTGSEHVDRIMRLIEARVTTGTSLDDVRPVVESIMTEETDSSVRYIRFTTLFRNLG